MIAAATAAPTPSRAIASRGTTVPGEKSRSLHNGWMASAIAGLKELAPYAAIELVLPGGSLIALLLWLHRRRQLKRGLTTATKGQIRLTGRLGPGLA